MAEKEGLKITRFAKPHLDALHHICRVNYHLIVTKGNVIVEETKEEHVVRFFFPEEVRHHLEENGFKLLRFSSFPDLNVESSEKTWNVAAISQVV